MITISVRGIEKVQKFLMELPANLRKIGVRAFSEYFVGDMGHGLKHYPKYSYVTRARGFPNLSYITVNGKIVKGYASARQHGYVMAMIAKGIIDPGAPHRTGNLQRGWKSTVTGGGYGSRITNDTPYVGYVMGDNNQTKMHNIIGWRHVSQVLKDNLSGALRHAVAEINKWIRANVK